MIKNILLINRTLRILFLSDTSPGSVHDKRIADTTPYPLPTGSHLLQDVGFQAFTLEGVAIIQPTKKPRGKELTPEQKADNREISRRRVRIEHVNSSVKRCRMLNPDYSPNPKIDHRERFCCQDNPHSNRITGSSEA